MTRRDEALVTLAILIKEREERPALRYYRVTHRGVLLATSPTEEKAKQFASVLDLPLVITPPGKRKPRRKKTSQAPTAEP